MSKDIMPPGYADPESPKARFCGTAIVVILIAAAVLILVLWFLGLHIAAFTALLIALLIEMTLIGLMIYFAAPEDVRRGKRRPVIDGDNVIH
jgi:hypothetical protein